MNWTPKRLTHYVWEADIECWIPVCDRCGLGPLSEIDEEEGYHYLTGCPEVHPWPRPEDLL